MATLKYEDIEKRNNKKVLVDRINGKGGFQLQDAESPSYKATGRVITNLGGDQSVFDKNMTEGSLFTFLNSRKTQSGSLDIELKIDNKIEYVRITKIYKDKEFGGVAAKASGQGSERQELGLIQAINEGVSRDNKSYIRQLGSSKQIIKAYKNEGLSPVGKEPYIDVVIETTAGKLGISCKGESAPSLAGGGVAGLKVIAPDLLSKLYTTIQNHMKNNMKLKQNDVVALSAIPEFYIKIPNSYVNKILEGNKQMGGPIDYMYVGPMDVTSSYNGPIINVNGNFYSIDQYMQKIGTFYFRTRRRDIEPSKTLKVEYQRRNQEGFPLLFTGPKTNKNNVRIVITDSVPSTGAVLTLR